MQALVLAEHAHPLNKVESSFLRVDKSQDYTARIHDRKITFRRHPFFLHNHKTVKTCTSEEKL